MAKTLRILQLKGRLEFRLALYNSCDESGVRAVRSKESIIKRTVAVLLALLAAVTFYILVKGWIGGHFTSIGAFRDYIGSYGIWAPLILVSVQALLAILPVFPSFFGCIAGAALFGTVGGFLTNYIGICCGSAAAYGLARRFGVRLVGKMISLRKYEGLIERINRSKSYPRLLFLAILLPVAPDNFLCYFSGLLNMPAGKFMAILIGAKPWCILLYSIFFARLL